MRNIIDHLVSMANLNQNQQAYIDLIRLGGLILIVAHFIGCFFFKLTTWESYYNDQTITWVIKQDIQNSGWIEKYFTSLYWAVITMITIGYGDITPTTIYEKIFVIFVSFIASGIFAYAINFIGTVVGEMSKKVLEQKQQVALLTSYMKQRGISVTTQRKVQQYTQFYIQKKELGEEFCEMMIKNLDQVLRKEYYLECYYKILKQEKLFSLNFSKQFLKCLAQKVKEKKLFRENLFDQGESLESIFILKEGKVESFVKKKNLIKQEKVTIVKSEIGQGEILGAFSFFSRKQSDEGIRAINIATFLEIKLEDFLQEIQKFPEDFENYVKIKENLQLLGMSYQISNKCNFCSKYTHRLNKCPLINCILNKDRIIHQANLNANQQRQTYQRKIKEKHKTLSFLLELQENSLSYLIEQNPQNLKEEEIFSIIQFYQDQEQQNFQEILLLNQQIQSDLQIVNSENEDEDNISRRSSKENITENATNIIHINKLPKSNLSKITLFSDNNENSKQNMYSEESQSSYISNISQRYITEFQGSDDQNRYQLKEEIKKDEEKMKENEQAEVEELVIKKLGIENRRKSLQMCLKRRFSTLINPNLDKGQNNNQNNESKINYQSPKKDLDSHLNEDNQLKQIIIRSSQRRTQNYINENYSILEKQNSLSSKTTFIIHESQQNITQLEFNNLPLLDIAKEFTHYHPQSNLQIVLANLNKIIDKNIQQFNNLQRKSSNLNLIKSRNLSPTKQKQNQSQQIYDGQILQLSVEAQDTKNFYRI